MSQCPCHTVYLTCCRSDAVNTWHDTTIRGSHGRRCRACCPALWVVVDTVQVDDHIVRKHLQRPGGIRGAVDQLVVGVDKRWSPVSIRCACVGTPSTYTHALYRRVGDRAPLRRLRCFWRERIGADTTTLLSYSFSTSTTCSSMAYAINNTPGSLYCPITWIK